MKKLLPVILVAFLFALAVGCGNNATTEEGTSGETGGGEGEAAAQSKLDELREAGVVRVGFANEAPYAYEENGELKGAAVEIAKAVFNELGIEKVEGHLAQWDQLIPGLKAQKFDAITAGMAILPKRCKQVDFSQPTVKYGEGLIVKKGNPLDLHSYEDIAANPDVKVIVMSGATENDFLVQAGVSEDQISNAPDIAATLSAVQAGRADATTATEMTVKKAVQEMGEDSGLEYVTDFEQPDVPGVPSYGGTAFHPDHDDLREAYNAKLKELRDNGTIANIFEDLPLWGEENIPEDGVTTEQLCQE
ncbi:MAG: ectoine/hydroxyectoine ABC transporter substrate-binding protein EhuB [Bacillaceae bacterium]|nr:ectoine/hydroxyectoine ABC transporter substrate-binding protein EhuB [Bacillaceae bacterium]